MVQQLIGPLHILPVCLMLAAAMAAAAFDIRSRRIPNALTVTVLAAGLAVHAVLAGPEGLLRAAAGAGLAFAIYFPLFLLRGMGAGDVKLMTALGAMAGPRAWFWILVVSSVAGALAGVALALARGRLRATLINTGFIVSHLIRFRNPAVGRQELSVHSGGALRLPHGVAIAFGTWVVGLAALFG